MSRKKIVAGNWKMNKTPEEAEKLVSELIPMVQGSDVDVVVCTPYTSLWAAANILKGTDIALGAQNMHFADSGAYTGEVSADMLLALGVKYVIIGHSERRQYFGETDDTVNKKILKALEKGLIPIVCCGESLEQRELGVTGELVRQQIKIAFRGVTAEQAKGVVIAYEPIWAIGTGKTATAQQANEVCAIIRGVIGELYGASVAEQIRIQYGGSMNAGNAAELMSQPDIDGGLIGGASLKAEDFTKIVKYRG
ncbi:MAG: Triosephosphate isomerase [Firmicutes bacterium ADurb.Bin193]|nr:MAG: Triosephosphate isomerase [Firmicutes bacterium ADurb.Bin193]